MEGIAAFALVLFLLIPGVAYASLASDQYGEPVYGPVTYDWQGETWTSVAYIAPNKFDAAAYACGYSKSEIGSWDLTVRAKLSNETTAPDFYELASGFYAPVADDFVYTDYGPAPGFWSWAYSIYGEGNIWYHDGYTDTQVNAAKSEVESILNGGGSGGGSGGGENTPEGYWHGGYRDGNAFTLVPIGDLNSDDSTLEITVSDALATWIDEQESANKKVCIEVTRKVSDARYYFLSFCSCPSGVYPKQDGVIGSLRLHNTNSKRVRVVNRNNIQGVAASVLDNIPTNVLSTTNWDIDANGIYGIFTIGSDQLMIWAAYDWTEGSGGDDEPPDNNWPDTDDPVVPDPPEPDAPSGGGNYVAPTLPKPTSPIQPTNVTVNVTTPVDDILDALNRIIQELENHCVHLQNKMVECSTYLGTIQEQTRDAVIDAINEGMQNDVALHDELMDYLQELFQWMRDNMNYNVEVTNTLNNDDVVDWLKRIYIQDGTGYSNSRPIDITQDYNGFGVWVDSLLGYVLPDLTDTNLAPVTSAFDALDDKFPFSVPGDVLRIFQSLDRSPVTPVVAVTIPSVLGIPAYTYSFDLSPYDTTMQTIRTIELMAFVVFLLVWARRAFNAEAGGASD